MDGSDVLSMARKLETEELVMCGLTDFLAAGNNYSYAEMEHTHFSKLAGGK